MIGADLSSKRQFLTLDVLEHVIIDKRRFNALQKQFFFDI